MVRQVRRIVGRKVMEGPMQLPLKLSEASVVFVNVSMLI